MEKVMFGDSGIMVSRMGLGLAALGRPGYINLGHADDLKQNYHESHMEQQTHHMIDLAMSLGINYIDAAQSYGKSENFLSSWLKKANRPDVVIGSKWGYTYTADWKVEAEQHEVKEHSLEVLTRQWPLSRKKLYPSLKLYQVHSATIESGVLENTQVLDRMAAIQDKGMIIGLSVSGPNQAKVIRKAMKISVDGKLLFGSIQVTNNLLESSTDGILKEATDHGLGIIIKEALANGRLTSRGEAYLPEVVQELSKMAASYHTTIDALSIAYLLHKPFAHVVLSGAAVPDHLLTNIQALDLDLTESDGRKLDQMRILPKAYWSARSDLKWN